MTLSVLVRKQLSSAFRLNVTFTARPGITMLFGPSGAGKTTILRAVAGLLTPDSGHIEIGTRVLFSGDRLINEPVEGRRIGYVFQQLALFPHLTVGENIKYGLHHLSSSDQDARAHASAESFRIGQLWNRRPNAISGGECQRVALARSLVVNPDVLLLDEPLTGLDRATQSHIIEDLRLWNIARQIPILYVTHAYREVFALGERVLVVERGEIVADGTPRDVLVDSG